MILQVWILHAAACASVCGFAVFSFCSILFQFTSRKIWNRYNDSFPFSARSYPMLKQLGLFASALHTKNEIRQDISMTNLILVCTLLDAIANRNND